MELQNQIKQLHKDLTDYSKITDTEKPLVVAGILLALDNAEKSNFSIESLNGDGNYTDGQKIYSAIQDSLKRVIFSSEVKIDEILSQFSVIKDAVKLNEKNDTLGKTPLKYYAEFLADTIYKSIKDNNSAEDFIGRFFGDFLSYSGNSSHSLGIVLTPTHITQLFCDLLDLQPEDKVYDACCGTGSFLVTAMYNMIAKATTPQQIENIKNNQLYGCELQPYMFALAITNIILRGNGKSNLQCQDFLKQGITDCNVGMLNPPYSQGSKKNPNLYEIAFVEHLLNSLVKGGRCAVIVPQSSMTGKTKEEKNIKKNILKNHTLEGVISLNKDTFGGVGTRPCIAIFTAGIPHDKDHICKFINFEDDGYKIIKHSGLIETESAKDKKQHLLDVWLNKVEERTKFCVKTTIEDKDEWLHSFYYYNDEIPTEEDFEKTINDYLTFEFSMIMQGRKYLFEDESINGEIYGQEAE